MLPATLAPGDVIRVPGGEGVVTAVSAEGGMVRVAWRDRTGPAFVFLPRTKPVLRRACAVRAPVV